MPPRTRGGGSGGGGGGEGGGEEEEAKEEEEGGLQAARAGRNRPVTAQTPGWEELPVCSTAL